MGRPEKKRGTAWPTTVLTIILILSTAVMIYLSNINAIAFDQHFYEDEYKKLNIYDRFSNTTDIDNETAFLISYLESGEGTIQSDFYNEKERIHMVEVRDLFRKVKIILDIAVILSAISAILLIMSVQRYASSLDNIKDYLKTTISNILIGIGAAVDGIAVLLGILSISFTSSFIHFHRLLFRTDTWMLNPATDNLVRMLPEQFFFDIFMRIVLTSVIFATILLAVGFLIKLGKPTFMKSK
ncbi:DUF1461 domain-containing protein [Nanoarchaeota archaeon]